MITLETTKIENKNEKNHVKLIQVLRPHSMPITVMSLNTSSRYVLYIYIYMYVLYILCNFIIINIYFLFLVY